MKWSWSYSKMIPVALLMFSVAPVVGERVFTGDITDATAVPAVLVFILAVPFGVGLDIWVNVRAWLRQRANGSGPEDMAP